MDTEAEIVIGLIKGEVMGKSPIVQFFFCLVLFQVKKKNRTYNDQQLCV